MERRSITVRGVVQGVGFRPFVFGLASRLDLNGFVKNHAGSVLIEVEGQTRALDRFLAELWRTPPPLSQVEGISWHAQSAVGEIRFRIEPSDEGLPGVISVPADVATCPECLAECLDPQNRRYRYPFLNCTNCGPRLTIIRGMPYDRERTMMARFGMCPACREEYENPADRRFHAQPTACPRCGPRLQAMQRDGTAIETGDPLAYFAEALAGGQIGALKGIGGFHLVCDAAHESAVTELRQRKCRDEKPFAVMLGSVALVRGLCALDLPAQAVLESPRRPIVLLKKRDAPSGGSHPVAEAVAPGNPRLGVMLPYTALHHLLLEALDQRPLVMTSGNRSDEPIAYENEDALQRLGGIADVFLMHNRPIHVRCDDSVTRIVDGKESPIRRSRGYVPQSVKLPIACPCPILAVGGQFKGTFAVARDNEAILSQHLGDLDHLEAYRSFERDIRLFERLFEIRPEAVVSDLHPDYASTLYARRRAEEHGLRQLAVQHHHAHMASCMAENGLTGPAIGVTFDGTGYGTDQTIWGGEILVGDYAHFRRAAHLRTVRMPGGDRAIREPWRMALSHVCDAGCDNLWEPASVSPVARRAVEQMLGRGFNSPPTSSAGRLFDAVAALAGVRERVSYEGQAAMQLEWLAGELPEIGAYPFEIESVASQADAVPPGIEAAEWMPPPALDVIDTRPMIRAVVDDVRCGTPSNRIARRFHSTLVAMIAQVCDRIHATTGIETVVLSGGVFMNALLAHEASARLADDGFRVFRHQIVPPNDGGLSLGQLAVAAATLQHQ